MKDIKKVLYIGAILSVSVLLCLQAGAISTTLQKQNVVNSATLNFADTCVSADNPDNDDIHPKLCLGPNGVMVCVYEKQYGLFSQVVPVAWSDDGGESWTTQFEFDSLEFTDGSGFLQYPDILYNSVQDVFFLTMLDPFAEAYNNEMSFIPGDIINAQEASWYGVSGQSSSDYYYCACANTDNFFLTLTTEDGYGFDNLFGLGYWTYPDFEHPAGMGGYYYDGQSEHVSAPAYELEIDSSGARILIVCETRLEGGTQITMKSTVTDEALLTSGEQQNGMDKWSDPEQFPGEYIAFGTDPDVSSSGTDCAVVFVDGGDVKCAYSSFSGTEYDPGFSWQFSTIDAGATPSVYMTGSEVQVAYAKDGNCYKAVSHDKGATWDTPVQVNQVDGGVISDPGSIDITEIGIVWTDNRDGQLDIYTAGAPDIPIIEVASISGGFGITATINNVGTADGVDVPCTITIDAPLMILGGEKTDTINVPMGGSATLKSGLIFGFGGATITVKAGDSTKTAAGTVLGPLVIGL